MEPAAALVDDDGFGGRGEVLSFEAALDVDEDVCKRAVGAYGERFIIGLTAMRGDTGGVFTHVDRFALRKFSGVADGSGDGSSRGGIDVEVGDRRLSGFGGRSLLRFAGASDRQKSGDKAKRDKSAKAAGHVYSLSFAGGPALGGRSPVREFRNSTRSARS